MFQKTQWQELDLALRPLIKDTLGLSQDACVEYLYGDSSIGLFGIPVTADDCDIAKVDTAFKLLTSPDKKVSDTAWDDLIATVEARQTNPASFEDIANYLSKYEMEFPSSGYHSVWTSARDASGRLNINWNISDSIPSINAGEGVITNRRSLFQGLRSFIRKNRAEILRSKRRQGQTFSAFTADKASTHFH